MIRKSAASTSARVSRWCNATKYKKDCLSDTECLSRLEIQGSNEATMVLLQHKLSVKLSQRQILTPGLVQMVSVLALNKLELKDMINAEMVENPVLEELEDSVPLIDEVGRKEEERDRPTKTSTEEAPITAEKKDPFEEIDFGSFFQDYLDPGYRTRGEMEEIERPSFENFLSKPTTLTDHLAWQLGALSLRPEVREAAEQIVGNLNEDGYLIASDEEMLGVAPPAPPEADAAAARNIVSEAAALGLGHDESPSSESPSSETPAEDVAEREANALPAAESNPSQVSYSQGVTENSFNELASLQSAPMAAAAAPASASATPHPVYKPNFTSADLQDAIAIVDQHLRAVQNKQHKDIAKAIGRPPDAVQHALDYIRTLDPRPGLQYNKVQARLIEPDVAFIKHGDEWLVLMNDDDLPQLRLNPAYKKLITRDTNDKNTRDYVKERYKSAIQLIKNIEQRKQTITKVCYCIVARQ